MEEIKTIYQKRVVEPGEETLVFSERRGSEENGGTSRFEKLTEAPYTAPRAFRKMARRKTR